MGVRPLRVSVRDDVQLYRFLQCHSGAIESKSVSIKWSGKEHQDSVIGHFWLHSLCDYRHLLLRSFLFLPRVHSLLNDQGGKGKTAPIDGREART